MLGDALQNLVAAGAECLALLLAALLVLVFGALREWFVGGKRFRHVDSERRYWRDKALASISLAGIAATTAEDSND